MPCLRQFTCAALLLALALIAGCSKGSASSAGPLAAPKATPDATDLYFSGPLVHLELSVSEKDVEKIHEENRPYVPCTLLEKDAKGNLLMEYKDVAIKLKGAAGSFQGFHEKPGLTIRPDKLLKKQKFHGLSKFHLNNSVQDETYLHEQLCGELFQKAGIPAPRVTHARVWLNGRDVGLYVVKEGFDNQFLARHFTNPGGNLYDGGFCTDIDSDLERDAGSGPNDFHDLQALRDACAIADADERYRQLEKLVDIEPFLKFMAMELMTCHWDGYALNRNNYRIYFEPTTKKAYWLPHGMDQMLGDPNASIVDLPQAIIASRVMENPVWRKRFRKVVQELLPLFSPPDPLLTRVDELHARIRPALAAMDEQLALHQDQKIQELKDRIVARAENLLQQESFPSLSPLEFNDEGYVHLDNWRAASELAGADLHKVTLPGDLPALMIVCRPENRCIASWRGNVFLAPGKYRLATRGKVENVSDVAVDDRGLGAGLRISGQPRTNHLIGNTDWTDLSFEFEVTDEPRVIELVAELRSDSGTAYFDLATFRLYRLPE